MDARPLGGRSGLGRTDMVCRAVSNLSDQVQETSSPSVALVGTLVLRGRNRR